MTTPDRLPTTGHLLSTEQLSNQDSKPKKKRKKKAKAADLQEEEMENVAGGQDCKLEFPGTGSDASEQVTGKEIVEGNLPPAEKKKREKKPKEKVGGKEPKEPKTPKTPKIPKTPKEAKEKKTKSSTPKAKTPKKSRYELSLLASTDGYSGHDGVFVLFSIEQHWSVRGFITEGLRCFYFNQQFFSSFCQSIMLTLHV